MTSEVEYRMGGVRGKVAKAKLLSKDRERVLHTSALTQDEISKMISVLRLVQQRVEPVSTRLPLEIREKFVVKPEELGKKPR